MGPVVLLELKLFEMEVSPSPNLVIVHNAPDDDDERDGPDDLFSGK